MANKEKNQGNPGAQHGVKGQGGDSVPQGASASSAMAGQGQSAGGMNAQSQSDAQATGSSNIEYDLVSILYHALQGAETYSQYLEDCRSLGDEELMGFIDECIDQERMRAQKAKRILMRHMGGQAGMERATGGRNAGM
jgi:hypothetical protein